MGSLLIRELDDDVKARLRVRAAEHGRSMEAEAREILAAAVAGRRPPQGLGTFIHAQFAPFDVQLDIAARTEPARAASLGGSEPQR